MRIAILGVGLIGGSIGLAARARAGAEVCGFDPDGSVLESALAAGAIDAASADLAAAVEGVDVVFAAAPVAALTETVRRALEAAGPECVVTDVGSTKRALAEAAGDERFIGGHPLAGAETAGVEHAREDLFDGATWYLTPAKGKTSGVLYERLYGVLRVLGARPVAIDADTHDRLMACVSHLPHVLANALVAQASELLASSPRLPAIGPSFRDATRVAGANSAIWPDIYASNRDALIEAVDRLTAALAEVRGMLAAGDTRALGEWNDASRSARDRLLEAGLAGAVGEAVHELRASVPNRPGVIAEIALALGGAGVNILDMALAPSDDNRQGVVALWIAGADQAERARGLIAGLGFPVVQA